MPTPKKRTDRRVALTDALLAALAQRPGLDKRQLQVRLAGGGLSAESGEINSVLYRRDDLFRAEGDTPPRWYLALEPELGADAPAGGPGPTGDLSAAVGPLPLAGRDSLAQVEPVPTYRPAPFQMRPPSLDEKAPPTTWGELSSRACATLEDPLVDGLVLHVDPGLRITIERVVLGFPWFVAWCTVPDDDLAAIVMRRHWHVWQPPHGPDWDRPGLIAGTAVSPAAATWRSERPLSVVRAVLGLVHDGLHARSLAGLLVDVVRPDAAESRRRRAEADREEEYRRRFVSHGFTGFVNPVRGACSCCGLPLRDPVSLRRGIGPDCWDGFYREFPEYVHRMRRADVRAQTWLGAVEAEAFRRRVADALVGARPSWGAGG